MKLLLLASLPLFCVAAAVIAADKSPAGTGPSFTGPIGLQLYSLRNEFKQDVPGSLDKVRDWSITNVELAGTYDLAPAKFREMLDARGLKAVSAHFPFDRFRDDIEAVASDARALGVKYTGVAWIPHTGDFDEPQCRKAIEVFNRAGEALARHGIQFFYHIHGYEFQPHGDGTLFDLMVAETKAVAYEMDVFWVVFPAQDPVRLLEKYGSRWALMHLKDMKKGLKTGSLAGKTDVANDVALGTGQMDWPAILGAAKKAGVKYYFIEDESPSSVAQIPQTLRYLEQVKW